MDKLNFKDTVAYGNSVFTHVERLEALYEQLVEKLYALGEDVAARIESPERVADALLKAAEAHIQRRNGYRLAEKALVTACRILNSVCPNDTAKLASAYRFLGHVCCRQGKHCQALKYNTLAALLMVSPQNTSFRDCKGR
jgi:AcrR family transcriptional regulator